MVNRNHNEAGPTFVARFADGEVIRMTIHCPKGLDWERGERIANVAWQTRWWQKMVEANRDALSTICDRPEPPAIVSRHFESDGVVLATGPDEEEGTQRRSVSL
jgi:hypothetical protein